MTPFVTKLKIDKDSLPKHIAIIMDGNRRWAKQNNLTVTEGHRAGLDNLDKIVDYCRDIGIKHLTVYALSTENWRKRDTKEVTGIFNMGLDELKKWKIHFNDRGVALNFPGNYSAFPKKVSNAIAKADAIEVQESKMIFNVALNYGGRDEIVNAIKKIVQAKIPTNKIDEKLISDYLYTKDQPDPDLIIRPGGEFRLSNFLLWQMSYAELYFTNILWPDFTPKRLEEAIYWYQQRDRRLGK